MFLADFILFFFIFVLILVLLPFLNGDVLKAIEGVEKKSVNKKDENVVKDYHINKKEDSLKVNKPFKSYAINNKLESLLKDYSNSEFKNKKDKKKFKKLNKKILKLVEKYKDLDYKAKNEILENEFKEMRRIISKCIDER